MRSTVSHPYIPPIPGSDGKHVVTDRDVLGGEATVGANVVVVDDVHTQEALSTAELILDQGKRVEVILRSSMSARTSGSPPSPRSTRACSARALSSPRAPSSAPSRARRWSSPTSI